MQLCFSFEILFKAEQCEQYESSYERYKYKLRNTRNIYYLEAKYIMYGNRVYNLRFCYKDASLNLTIFSS